jgi:hypothetical protein
VRERNKERKGGRDERRKEERVGGKNLFFSWAPHMRELGTEAVSCILPP